MFDAFCMDVDFNSAAAPRHAVETEEDPEQLFRELMAACPDGRVPPHLLDRLRQLEQSRVQPRPIPAAVQASGKAAGRSSTSAATASNPDLELYEAFEDLLRLADDNDRDSTLPSRSERSASQSLRPQPSQRPQRL